ncbi:MAG TPA: penicillin-binding protein 2 [Gemmatimonadota bacterium]|nr:penicillin-binding protein 2 [Gemmatimonadota bacterium]
MRKRNGRGAAARGLDGIRPGSGRHDTVGAREAALKVRAGRARGATILLWVAMSILLVSFFRLQILGREQYELQSEENRLRALTIPPPRGTITDRNGRLLAENVPGYSLSVLPGPVDTVRATLLRLAPHVGLDDDEVEELVAEYRGRPSSSVVVRDNLEPAQVAAIEQRRPEFRTAVIEMHPRRYYPPARQIAHVIGYVNEINEAELEQPQFEGYESGRTIGKGGIERQYERELGGTPGVHFVEVNARGSIVSEFAPRPTIPAVPGGDIELALDLDLQAMADSLFPDTMKGGVVAFDPRNGEVVLLYSHPTYDPNQFIGGISSADWARLRDDPRQPLLNRASGSLYPPGSTWKLVVAALGMRAGVVTIDTHMPQSCTGAYQYGTRAFRCWKHVGHGNLSLAGAIKESCNVFFYQLGLRLGLDRLLAGVDGLEFNGRAGLDLPVEARGQFPPSREWYDERFGRRGWTESVTLNLSIGQGETAQTLLRMAQFYGALAVGGSPPIPHLRRSEVLDARRADWSIELPDEQRRQLLDALTRVVNEPGGTAFAYRPSDYVVAGKTGTAQNPHGEPHSWFVGFGPVDDPRIVIAAIVENGHPDNTVSLAVPLATSLMQAYLRTEGVPATGIPYPRPGSRPTPTVPAPGTAAPAGAPTTGATTTGAGG